MKSQYTTWEVLGIVVAVSILFVLLGGCVSTPACTTTSCRLDQLEAAQQRAEHKARYRRTCTRVHGSDSILCR